MKKLMMSAAVLLMASSAHSVRFGMGGGERLPPQTIHYRDGSSDFSITIAVLDASPGELEAALSKIVQTMFILARQTNQSIACAWSRRTQEVLQDWTVRRFPPVTVPSNLPVSEIVSWSRSQAEIVRKRQIIDDAMAKLGASCAPGPASYVPKETWGGSPL